MIYFVKFGCLTFNLQFRCFDDERDLFLEFFAELELLEDDDEEELDELDELELVLLLRRSLDDFLLWRSRESRFLSRDLYFLDLSLSLSSDESDEYLRTFFLESLR